MSNYDAWLEAPYQQRYAEDDAYFDFCESRGLDPEDDNEAAWEDYKEAMSEPDPDLAYDLWRESQYDEYEPDYGDEY